MEDGGAVRTIKDIDKNEDAIEAVRTGVGGPMPKRVSVFLDLAVTP